MERRMEGRRLHHRTQNQWIYSVSKEMERWNGQPSTLCLDTQDRADKESGRSLHFHTICLFLVQQDFENDRTKTVLCFLAKILDHFKLVPEASRWMCKNVCKGRLMRHNASSPREETYPSGLWNATGHICMFNGNFLPSWTKRMNLVSLV